MLAKQSSIAKLGHKYAAALTADGEFGHGYLCQNGCGTYNKFVPHVYDNPNCEEDGECSCGYEKGAGGAHTWKLSRTEPATCVVDGTAYYACAVTGCGATYEEAIEAHGVEHTLWGYDPTCSSTGLGNGTECSFCHKVLIPQEKLPKQTHEYELTADAYGHWEECTLCGATKSYSVHKYESGTLCGSGAHCTVCNEVMDGHQWGKGKAYTCKTHGNTVTAYACSNKSCNKFTRYETDGNITCIDGYAATCVDTGLDVGFACGDCDKVLLKQATLKKLGHQFSTDLKSDVHGHWYECTRDGCTEVNKAAPHAYATATSIDCKDCGWKHEVVIPVDVHCLGNTSEAFIYFHADGSVTLPELADPIFVQCWDFQGWLLIATKGNNAEGICAVEYDAHRVAEWPEFTADQIRTYVNNGYGLVLEYVGEFSHAYENDSDLFCDNPGCFYVRDGLYPLTVVDADEANDDNPEFIEIVDGNVNVLASYWSDGKFCQNYMGCYVYVGWKFTAEDDVRTVDLGVHTQMNAELEAELLSYMEQGYTITVDCIAPTHEEHTFYEVYPGYESFTCANCDYMKDSGVYPIIVDSLTGNISPEDDGAYGFLTVEDGHAIIRGSDGDTLPVVKQDLAVFLGWEFTAREGRNDNPGGTHTEMNPDLENWIMDQIRAGRIITMRADVAEGAGAVGLIEANGMLFCRLFGENQYSDAYLLRFVSTKGKTFEQYVCEDGEGWEIYNQSYSATLLRDLPAGTYKKVDVCTWNESEESWEYLTTVNLLQTLTVTTNNESVKNLSFDRVKRDDLTDPELGKLRAFRSDGTVDGYLYTWGFGDNFPIGDFSFNENNEGFDIFVPEGADTLFITGMKVTSASDTEVKVTLSNSAAISIPEDEEGGGTQEGYYMDTWVDSGKFYASIRVPDNAAPRARYASIRELPASKREFSHHSALKSHGMRTHYRGFLPSLAEKLFFLKCYAVLRERFFLARALFGRWNTLCLSRTNRVLAGGKIRAKPDKSLWNAA